VQFALTAERAMLAPIAVWAWQVLGAGITFRRVRGQPFSVVSWVISIAFVALVASAGTELVNPALFTLACVGLIAALLLFEWARRTIRGQFFSWIFSSDTPAFLCTTGPFAYVRNPFYTSYLLTMASAVVIVPSVLRAAVFAGMVIYFLRAALHEEKKFARSELAEEYARYQQRTGRFLPTFSAVRR
jgi:protein-S-isoprenylcysteine O-methyltransferase Ste14